MFKATATICYDPARGNDKAFRKGFQSWWLAAMTPPSISYYYAHWVKKELGWKLNTPLWKSHITIIRGEAPHPSKEYFWKRHQGRKVEFTYSPEVCWSDKYVWLHVESPELEAIRVELGLPPQPRCRLHLTIGNRKNLAEPEKSNPPPACRLFPWERQEVFENKK